MLVMNSGSQLSQLLLLELVVVLNLHQLLPQVVHLLTLRVEVAKLRKPRSRAQLKALVAVVLLHIL